MPNKSHKNAIELHKNKLEQNNNFRCKKEFDLARQGLIHRIDLACFRDNPKVNAVALEIESDKNFNNPQIRSNAEDLQEFKKQFPKSRAWHLTTDMEIDFKELGE